MDIVKEWIKCYHDIPYYAQTYCRVFDQTQGGFVSAKVFPRQRDLLKQLQDERYNLVLKPRQAGVSTISALYCAHLILFATEDSPQKILIVANKRETAREFLEKIKGYIATAPQWLGLHKIKNKDGDTTPYDIENTNQFVLTNGSGAKAVGTGPDALRGYTPTMLVLDEAAFIRGADALWTGAAPSLSTGGRALFISTPNGQDPLYYKTYKKSLEGEGIFKIFDMFWWQDPRFNKDLSFLKPRIVETEDANGVKTKEIIKERCYARKLEDGTWDFNHVKNLIANKWEATSSWFEEMCLTYNNDERRIAQELKTVFTGSGDNVIKDDYIMEQEANTCLPKWHDGFDNNIWIWEQPIAGHQYILGSDVSRGDSDDYSTFTIFDMTTMNQVLEWHGKCPPDVLGEIINEWGTKYQAYAVIDVTGGLGTATALKLKELEYPWIHHTIKGGKFNPSEVSESEKVPGFLVSKNRTMVIQCLEEAIRTNMVTIRSMRMVEEMKTFVYINGRPDHLKGYHDDLLFSLGMILYVFQFSFKELQKYDEQTKVMLDSWLNQESKRETIKIDNNPNGFDWIFSL